MNADLGEGFPNDRKLLELVTSASICCGAHAGSPDVIRRDAARRLGLQVVVGRHPGYQDREGFGRRDQKLSRNLLGDLFGVQLGTLCNLAEEIGVEVLLRETARSVVQPGPAATRCCRPGCRRR